MAQKKISKASAKEEAPKLDVARESLLLGHLIKYNLYLLTKSIIFSSLVQHLGDVDKATQETNRVIGELDLDTKKRTEQQ